MNPPGPAPGSLVMAGWGQPMNRPSFKSFAGYLPVWKSVGLKFLKKDVTSFRARRHRSIA